jgi:hypothetical protein
MEGTSRRAVLFFSNLFFCASLRQMCGIPPCAGAHRCPCPMRVFPPKRFVQQAAQCGCARNTHPLAHTHRVRALQEYIAAEVHFNVLVCTAPTTGITQFYGAYRRPCTNASPAWHGGHRGVATPTHSVVLLHELCTGGSIADFAASLASAVDTAAGGALSSAAPEPLPEVRAQRCGHLICNAAHVRVCRR